MTRRIEVSKSLRKKLYHEERNKKHLLLNCMFPQARSAGLSSRETIASKKRLKRFGTPFSCFYLKFKSFQGSPYKKLKRTFAAEKTIISNIIELLNR